MSGLYGRAPIRWLVGIGLCGLYVGGCAADVREDGTSEAEPVAVNASALGGAGAPAACVKKDTADTTCNAADDDCDGKLDEDCSFGPLQCPAGYNVVAGTYKDDLLVGTIGRDCILGYGGKDTILGLAGDDMLVGGPGNDSISGSTGNDTIQGGDGDDSIEGGAGADTIDGGNGNDTIDGQDGGDTVHGGACHDRISGGNRSDKLFGDGGSDRITCTDRRGTIDGGQGTDACDGTHCELASSSKVCLKDRDCGNGKVCVRGANVGICAPANEAPTTDATCDGIDDDCDGKVDENFVASVTHCGAGACASTGMSSCVQGHLQDTCTTHPTAGNDATCDGVDDDCDGHVDENYASTPTSCGVGACGRTGTNSCVMGHVNNSCTPGTPAASDASCNNIDDNCNGQIDEQFVGGAITCGVGACSRSGNVSCVAGHETNTCVPGTPAPSDATCNGVDDNCNGQTDEQYVGGAITCGVGACRRSGNLSCVAGHETNSCVPGAPAPSDATCDNVDDNCNGQTDEEYVTVGTICGVGACLRSGSMTCVGGHETDSCTPGTPAPSDATCDNVDDNCNGQTDEQYVTVGTICGVGACLRSGHMTCTAGHENNDCAPGTPASSDTICDNVDSDCNGETDEDFVSVATQCGVGACHSTGSTSCSDGMMVNSCSPGTPAASDTTCNDVDDNCNGQTDEGFVSTSISCGVGECVRSGNTVCTAGSVQQNCTPGTPAADDATCDNKDEDCSGTADEDYVQVGVTCGIGACLRTGHTTCSAGSEQNVCTAGTPAPSDSTCDGVDDNCNGTSDEQFVASCSGSTRVTCAAGQVQNFDCNNADACDGLETCSAGACQPGAPVNVDDSDPCTADTCTAGMVQHTPVSSGTSCSDSNVCNGSDQCLVPSAGTCAPLTSGAIAWWPGDDHPRDIIGGADGTLLGGMGYGTGEAAHGFNLDGLDDAVDVSAHAATLNLAGQATLEMWLRTGSNTCRTVFHLRQDATHEQFLQIGDGCNATLRNELVTYTYINGAVTSIEGYTTTARTELIDAARFHHLAITLDGKNTVIYIDGVAHVPTVAVGTDHGDWGAFASPVSATIGGRQPSIAGDSFIGQLDEVTLYDHALSAAQIMAVVTAGTSGQCKPLTCTPVGPNAPSGTSCGASSTCNGAGMCLP